MESPTQQSRAFFMHREAIRILNLDSQVALLKIGITWPSPEKLLETFGPP